MRLAMRLQLQSILLDHFLPAELADDLFLCGFDWETVGLDWCAGAGFVGGLVFAGDAVFL